jgi:hypothetical protein
MMFMWDLSRTKKLQNYICESLPQREVLLTLPDMISDAFNAFSDDVDIRLLLLKIAANTSGITEYMMRFTEKQFSKSVIRVIAEPDLFFDSIYLLVGFSWFPLEDEKHIKVISSVLLSNIISPTNNPVQLVNSLIIMSDILTK